MVLAGQGLFTGKPVYNGGSTRPTAGTVNPQGYLDREVRRRSLLAGVSKTGTDGKSDTRSGLAAGMLRAGSAGGTNPQQPNTQMDTTKFGTGVVPVQEQQSQQQQQSQPQYSMGNSSPNPNPHDEVTPVAPIINVNPVGNLQLPWDEATNYEAVQQQASMQQALQQMQLDQQQQQATYEAALKEAAKQYTTQKRGRLNDNASRGTAFSSAYGVQMGNDSSDYNSMINKVQTERGNANNNYNLGVSGIQNAFSGLLQNLAYQKSLKAAENAASMSSLGGPGGPGGIAALLGQIDKGGNVGQLNGGPGSKNNNSPFGLVKWPGQGNGNGPNKDGGKNKKGKN